MEASRQFLLCVPSVLLVANSSLLKKCGSNLSTHLSRLSALLSVPSTPPTFVRVTQVRISSPLTSMSDSLTGAESASVNSAASCSDCVT